MRRFIIQGCGVLLAASLLWQPAGAAPKVTGDYLEARSCSVFIGACHRNAQYDTSGREAILVWHVRSGSWEGVSLAGVRVAAVVAGTGNLSLKETERRSVLFVDAEASKEQREAVVGFLKARYAGALGKVVTVRTGPVAFQETDRGFAVQVSEALQLTVDRLPNRECCTMPYQLWYQPFVPLEGRRAGTAVRNRFRDADGLLGARWSLANEVSAFYGRFSG